MFQIFIILWTCLTWVPKEPCISLEEAQYMLRLEKKLGAEIAILLSQADRLNAQIDKEGTITENWNSRIQILLLDRGDYFDKEIWKMMRVARVRMERESREMDRHINIMEQAKQKRNFQKRLCCYVAIDFHNWKSILRSCSISDLDLFVGLFNCRHLSPVECQPSHGGLQVKIHHPPT